MLFDNPTTSWKGDVAGPAVAVDGDLCAFDGVSGKKIKDASVTALDVLNSKYADLVSLVTPLFSHLLPIYDGAYKNITYADLMGSLGGWIPAGETWTYSSSDAPSYVFTISGDKTSKYVAGMKVKLVDNSTVKYFFITKVTYSAPNTLITLFGGTDYTLTGGVITLPFYSMLKTPVGFSQDPAKWSVTVIDTTGISQAPVADTWYNNTNCNINVPIGLWILSYKVFHSVYKSATGVGSCFVTISTANNSESNPESTSVLQYNMGLAGAWTVQGKSSFATMTLNLTAKATYYMNIMTHDANVDGIYVNIAPYNGSNWVTVVCAYL